MYDSASVNVVAFGSFKPTNIEHRAPKTIKFQLIDKIGNKDGLVLITISSWEEIRVHPDLINDDDWKKVKPKSTTRERRNAKRFLRNLQPAVKK